MPQARLIKSRIRSAKNIAKITKAMEMVSASKMRRSQQQALSSRPYTHKLVEMLHTIASHTDPSFHKLLQSPANTNAPQCMILISTDRGLAGSLNANLFRAAFHTVADLSKPTVYIVVGKKAKDYVKKINGTIVAEFTGLPDKLTLGDVLPISEVFVEGFLKGEFSSVMSIHMQFVSTLSQQPETNQLLPIATTDLFTEKIKTETVQKEYLFEPSPKEILDVLLPFYIENGFYQIMLEAKASEHSARMVSMKNASDNAGEIVDSLLLEYNKTRQASITSELLDITTASLSVNNA